MASQAAKRRGLLIILSSPSGAGKTTLTRMLDWDGSMQFSVSATTRPPRDSEKEGREYFFKTHEQFNELVAAGEMLEHAEVFGNLYGSPRAPVEKAISQGRDVIFDIDWQGGQQIVNSSLRHDVVSIFILPPSIAELERRLRGRGQDSEDVIKGRMQESMSEISHWGEYDYVVVNRELEDAADQLRTILKAERLRRGRQTGLNDFVRHLNAEFEDRE